MGVYALNAVDTPWPDLARFNAQEWDYVLLKAHVGYGVKSGLAITQHGGGNMSVDVASGHAWVAFVDVTVGSATLAIAASHPTNPRWDVVQVSPGGVLSVKTGTMLVAVEPPLPVPDANATVIGFVYVRPAATAITDGTGGSDNLIRTVGVTIAPHLATIHGGNVAPIGSYLELTEIAAPAAATDKSRIYRDSTLNALMSHSDGLHPAPLEGLEFLASNKLVAPSSVASFGVTFQARDHLVVYVRHDSSSGLMLLTFNGDAAAHYSHRTLDCNSAGPTIFANALQSASDTSISLGAFGMGPARIEIANAAAAVKSLRSRAVYYVSLSAYDIYDTSAIWNNTADRITSIQATTASGVFNDGASMTVFGYNDGPNYD